MNQVKVQRVVAAIEANKGKMFTVEFEKANGEKRKMNCRTGVKKHLKGGETTYNKADKKGGDVTIGVYENGNDYRCFKASKVLSLKIAGDTIEF
ncbi:MAG: hypothetical protein GWN01_12180 [Nitrosopumilaceae archaeon]|nr:hypothetical protein [Nitrosopumilaceae archaeon]NIU88052.1 hypothetical protein [Nitrosopumilaceae archaeon]NIX62236.1 hypothetical protein [Nitrosopumilaceae archaeon]